MFPTNYNIMIILLTVNVQKASIPCIHIDKNHITINEFAFIKYLDFSNIYDWIKHKISKSKASKIS